MQGKEYLGLSHISGPIIVVEGVKGVGFDEMVEITDPDGNTRIGRVLEISAFCGPSSGTGSIARYDREDIQRPGRSHR